jgi:RHS repeat-associated protein
MVYQQTGTMASPGTAIDTLQFISHEEGRVRWAYHTYTIGPPGYAYAYDFYEKDQLGNTRMVLTQERDTTNYIATMEAAYRSTESQLFANIASTSFAWDSMPNYQNIPHSIRYPNGTTANDSVSKVDYNGTSGQTTGPSLLLKVMAGDTIMPVVQCYYVSNTLTTTNSSLTSVLNSLAGGIMGTPTGAAEGTLSGYTSTSSPVYSGLGSFLGTKDQAPPSGYPKAYLNWILLDDQFNYVSSSSGSVAAASATTYPANQMNTVAPGGPVVMSRNGYLYVWVSNETQGWDVFFDNFSVYYKQGPVLEENHYYPFGLSMSGISDKAIKTSYAENKYRYNGKELQHQEFSDGTGLEEYDYGARMQDPQLGVWHNIDPKADKMRRYSPYAYAFDNPIRFIDPDGMAPEWIAGTDGKKVTYTKDNQGNVTWSKNASADVKRVGNDLLLTKTGTSQLNKLISSDIKVKISISPEANITKVTGGTSYTYGGTIQGNASNSDNHGIYINKDGTYGIKEASITIYAGTIAEGIKAGSGLKHEGLTMDEAIGATAGHEIVHGTDKGEINKDIKYAQEHDGALRPRSQREAKAEAVENKIIQESKTKDQ